MANEEEEMDTSNNATMLPQPKSGVDAAKKDEDKAELKVSLWSPETIETKKFKRDITKTLQTWANKNAIKGEFEATEISDDGRTAVITVRPAAALKDLLTLSEKELITKEQKKFSIKMHQNEPSQVDKKSSLGQASPLNLTNAQNGQLVDMSKNDSSADDGNGNPLIVALAPYWYIKSIYPDHIQFIEEQNRVKITENVQVTISADQKHSDPNKAYDDFIKLVQSCLSESSSSLTIPLKKIGLEEWMNTLHYIQSTGGKCQITISSDHVTIFGPQQYQTAISKSLQRPTISTNYTDDDRMQKEQERVRPRINSSSFDEERKIVDRSRIRIKMTSKDPFVSEGLTFEEQHWDLMTKHNKKDIERIKDKFNVTFIDKRSQGKANIRVHYNKPEGNVSMESHAIRALLRLYQKATANNFRGTNGMFDNLEMDMHRGMEELKGAYGQTSTDRQVDNTKRFTEEGATKEPSGAKAKKDEKEEETCPVCMDSFKEKTALRCKHEFCKDCLDRSVKSLGATCPVCKDVFGLVEGDQPDGTMTWYSSTSTLPGFHGCGSIVITYDIPSGIQTKKHSNPGRTYHGLNRTAYLPDNREGKEVLKLLKRAFDQRLIFTVGTSRTTGQDNVVTWNDIHHKTSTYGGQQGFGYPDPDYLSRVKDELKAKGIK